MRSEKDEKVPFANVHYLDDYLIKSMTGSDFEAFKQAVLKAISENQFNSVRVVGTFKMMHTRAVVQLSYFN